MARTYRFNSGYPLKQEVFFHALNNDPQTLDELFQKVNKKIPHNPVDELKSEMEMFYDTLVEQGIITTE